MKIIFIRAGIVFGFLIIFLIIVLISFNKSSQLVKRMKESFPAITYADSLDNEVRIVHDFEGLRNCSAVTYVTLNSNKQIRIFSHTYYKTDYSNGIGDLLSERDHVRKRPNNDTLWLIKELNPNEVYFFIIKNQ